MFFFSFSTKILCNLLICKVFYLSSINAQDENIVFEDKCEKKSLPLTKAALISPQKEEPPILYEKLKVINLPYKTPSLELAPSEPLKSFPKEVAPTILISSKIPTEISLAETLPLEITPSVPLRLSENYMEPVLNDLPIKLVNPIQHFLPIQVPSFVYKPGIFSNLKTIKNPNSTSTYKEAQKNFVYPLPLKEAAPSYSLSFHILYHHSFSKEILPIIKDKTSLLMPDILQNKKPTQKQLPVKLLLKEEYRHKKQKICHPYFLKISKDLLNIFLTLFTTFTFIGSLPILYNSLEVIFTQLSYRLRPIKVKIS